MLSDMTQEQALDVLKTGGNVFLTGEPGSGKTYVVNQYIAWLEACGLTVAVTASTGIAATHIGGMTIHAWSGIGARDQLSAYDLDQITTREKIVKRAKKTNVLIIDEISMLDGALVDMLNVILRRIRQSNEPFGGIQVVFVGDFFQLPPVTKQGDAMRYAFESRGWEEARPLICYLTDQYRQDDELLLSLLKSIRTNDVEDEHFTLLSEQTDIAYEGIEPTRLFTHNADVDAVNTQKLQQLPGAAHTYRMSSKGSKPLVEGLVKNCLSPAELVLKEDAMVMCTKNNFEAGYVNGTLGRVVEFDPVDGYPIIETAAGKRIKIEPTNWSYAEENKVLAEITQLPLRLAWAITVHKSQGMSLDAAEIDLTRAFVFGQGYVALSRVRTLGGLKMLGMNPTSLRVDPKIVQFDQRLRDTSDETEATFAEMDETDVTGLHKAFIAANSGTYVTEVTETATPNRQRIQKESTYEQTKQLLEQGKLVAAIAKERGIAESTVWTHLEKLVADGAIERSVLERLTTAYDDWGDSYLALESIMTDVGTETLKPIYEAAGEEYDYTQIRLARMLFVLHNQD